ncbi:hypothetical protein MPSEU_000170300 [Mayamaea pseudoterrestris]|nr:hypothetical protein MPSEU_000170300 [Mayamaea pseudoterrestris]
MSLSPSNDTSRRSRAGKRTNNAAAINDDATTNQPTINYTAPSLDDLVADDSLAAAQSELGTMMQSVSLSPTTTANYLTSPPKLLKTGNTLTGKISTLFRRDSSKGSGSSVAAVNGVVASQSPKSSSQQRRPQSSSYAHDEQPKQRIFYSNDSDDSFESRVSTRMANKSRGSFNSKNQQASLANSTTFYSDDEHDDNTSPSSSSSKTILRYRGFSTSIQSLFLDEPLVCAACGCFGLFLSNRTEYLLQLRQDKRGTSGKNVGNSTKKLPSRIVAYGLVITIMLMFSTFIVFGFGSSNQASLAEQGYDYYADDKYDASSNSYNNGNDANDDDASSNANDDAAGAVQANDDAAAQNDDGADAAINDDGNVAADDANNNDDAQQQNDDAADNNGDDYYAAAADDDSNRRLVGNNGRRRQQQEHSHMQSCRSNGVFKLRDTQECVWDPVIDFVKDEWYRNGQRPEMSWHRRQEQTYSDDEEAEPRDLGSNIRIALFFSFLLFLGVLGRRRRMRTRFYLVKSRAQEDHLFYASTQIGAARRINFEDTRENQYEGACSHTLCGCYPVDYMSKDDKEKIEQVEVLDTGIGQRKPKRFHEDIVARGFNCFMAICCGAVCKCWFQCLSVCALAQEAREMRLLIPPRYQRIDFITHQPFHEYQKDVINLRLGWMGKSELMRGIMPHWSALSRLSRYILVCFTISVLAIVATLLFNPRAAFAWQDAVVLAATFLQSFLVLFIVHWIFHKSDLSVDAVIKLFAAGFVIAVPSAFFFEGLLVNIVLFGAWGLFELLTASLGDSFTTWVFDHWRLIWIFGELFNAYVVAAITEELCKYYTFRAVEHPDLMFLTGLHLDEHRETAVDGGIVNYPFSSNYIQEINKELSDDASVSSHRSHTSRNNKRKGASRRGKALLDEPEREPFEDEEPEMRSYRQMAMAITTGMISVAVGLACAENFLYVFVLGGALGSTSEDDQHKGDILEAWIVLFFRSIFPIHALAAAMQSINMIRKFVETTEDDGHRIGVGRIILPAVLLHGTFDAVLMGINVYIETSWDKYLEENDGNVGEDAPYNSIVVNAVAWLSITAIMITGLVWYFVQNRRQSSRLSELEESEKKRLQESRDTSKRKAPKTTRSRLLPKGREVV